MKNSDEHLLLARVAERESRALEELILRHSVALATTCRNVLGPFGRSEDVEEVLGDVFFHVWTAPEEFDRARGDVTAWLKWLTISRALTRRRSIVRRLKNIQVGVDPAELDLPDDQTGDDGSLAKRELLLEAIDRLRRESAEDAEIVHRRYILRQKPSEIAQSLGIDANRARVRLFRSVKKIRQILSETEPIA